ncbi:MAG: methyltransferase [Flavihumibacter sp.]|nr:methyltransferase [Flavihumibacter sp.]
MANTYFQFKAFRVDQEDCAMKVCTEACLFGAWLAEEFRGKDMESALDIGTGTGLLSLMLAQETTIAKLDAIELDEPAAKQAKVNFETSPWGARLQVFQGDALRYSFPRGYSLVFSNPPFFEQSLLSPDARLNQAKHESSLDISSLLQLAEELTTDNGYFAILLPYQRAESLLAKIATSNFQLYMRMNVCQTEKHASFRSFCLFRKNTPCNVNESTICIRENGNYSAAFSRLLQPFYLYL